MRLSHILSVETLVASFTGDLISKRAAAQEGCELAEAIGYRAGFIRCRWYLGLAQLAQGDCAGAVEHFGIAGAAAEAGHYANFQKYALAFQGIALAWGAALSTEEAIAYARRGRGQRKRPTSGWASLTPTERDVVRLVSDGLGNNDIAIRLFISPRTVQTHLTHVYTKLGLTSRVQLVQEAARHTTG